MGRERGFPGLKEAKVLAERVLEGREERAHKEHERELAIAVH